MLQRRVLSTSAYAVWITRRWLFTMVHQNSRGAKHACLNAQEDVSKRRNFLGTQTNHSLHATGATQLFQAEVPKLEKHTGANWPSFLGSLEDIRMDNKRTAWGSKFTTGGKTHRIWTHHRVHIHMHARCTKHKHWLWRSTLISMVLQLGVGLSTIYSSLGLRHRYCKSRIDLLLDV